MAHPHNTTMSMPGAFNSIQQRDHGSAPRLSGAKSHIFQPPRTRSDSASSSLILTRSTNSLISASTATSTKRRRKLAPRKRSRVEDTHESHGMEEDWSAMMNGSETNGIEVCPGSPKPFVNTKYVLAGGMDTPTLKAAQLALAGDNDYSDVGYRKSMGGDGMVHTKRGLFCDLEGPSYFPSDLGREANGRGRGWNSPGADGWNSPGADGWSKTAIQVVGDVVGKVWEFCKSSGTMFKGFHAGGGNGYTISNSANTPSYKFEEIESSIWETEKLTTWGGYDRESTPLPGQFPEEDYIPNYLDHTTPDTNPHPAKRRQVSRSSTTDTISKNWVVVPPVEYTTPSKPQPRAPSRFSMPTASSANRRSVATTIRPASRAGFAGSGLRRPMLSRVSHAGSPALNSNQGASFASPRSSPTSKIPRASPMRGVVSPEKKVTDSPAAKEAQRWAALKRKEEREADESIRRLDRQLKAMIKEGKEALGTKIEVEIDDDIDFQKGPGNIRKWAI